MLKYITIICFINHFNAHFQIQQTGTLVFIGRGLKEKILINLEKSINYGIFKFSEFVRKIFL